MWGETLKSWEAVVIQRGYCEERTIFWIVRCWTVKKKIQLVQLKVLRSSLEEQARSGVGESECRSIEVQSGGVDDDDN